jgi:hypothetical protein
MLVCIFRNRRGFKKPVLLAENLLNCIRTCQSQFLGHVIRRGGLKNIRPIGENEGRRDMDDNVR